ncbi:MAG TPA: PrsW family glutamic-type intramembrane protease [Casimicrobiaceae bacterium]|nr:PrsW family glutamic-type intramembrane protease [Casimicrobiaceae bacterium]
MTIAILPHLLIGMLPVLAFLAALLYLDGYKLVTMRAIIAMVLAGVAMAGVSYFANGGLAGLLALDFTAYSRYVGPLLEEVAKGLVIVALIRTNRIGFLVDAAICGFAVGTGFAILENVYYQHLVPDAGLGTWIVRGFGTAIMHGGSTAIFAVMGLAMTERSKEPTPVVLLPGLALAVVLHSAFNHLSSAPRVATLGVLFAMPPLLYIVFQRSERAVANWLGQGFDADADMLQSITSGDFPDSQAGRYLATLKHRFKGPVVADLLCYLRLHAELALRAKGILMMRENGFEATVDDTVRAGLDEMRYLERSIGKTGRLALKPLLRGGSRDLWQLRMLESESIASDGSPAPGASE